ncbi:MAG: 4Fe-4S binding protein [Aureliella sp.]
MSPPVQRNSVGRYLAVALILIGLLLSLALWMQWGSVGEWDASNRNWGWIVASLSLFLGLMFTQSAWSDQRSKALLRLDWFLPAIRRLPADSEPSQSLFGHILRMLGPGLQSNWQTKKRGPARRWLRFFGISWVASPVRRISQTICLLLFCWLFFYVCWPYHAQPVLPKTVANVTYSSFEQEKGIATFRITKQIADAELVAGDLLYLKRTDITFGGTESEALLGAFRVHAAHQMSDDTLQLKPAGELSPMFLDIITGVANNLDFEATDSDPFAWPDHYAASLDHKELLEAETFLMIDPLVSLSTAIASRSWVWSLGCAAAILFVCIVIPRGFCGYLCPLGTTIDLFDWAIAGRTKRFEVPDDGWWVHIKYYLLTAILLAACGGILISGFFSAIPVVTRGYLFLLDPLQNGLTRGWHLVPNLNAGHFLSIAMFFSVLGLGFLRPRFWCKYVCPSGAVFSVGNLFRATERKVESSCIHCNKCVEICPFDAIKPDFTTRTTDCTLCQSCAGVCPTHAIKFVERTNLVQLKVENEPPTKETSLGRRGFLSLTAGTAASVAGAAGVTVMGKAYGAHLGQEDTFLPVRPPGSVPEKEFLEMCIRCGECFKACPNNVLQPESFQQGFEGLWTPMVQADWAGCESSCNACGQVCPTGAIRALPLEEKRHARMGLAIVNESTCLPFAEKEACDLCVQECIAAGYDAIEYTQVGVETDENGRPIEGTGYAAPVVLADKCVGCGLCQTRCYAINVKERHVLGASAIIVEAGEGKEDRLMSGSYIELHSQRTQPLSSESPEPDPDELNGSDVDMDTNADPFGISPEASDEDSPF